MPGMYSPPRVRRGTKRFASGVYATPYGKRAKIFARSMRINSRLARAAIAARVNVFKRSTDAFGFRAGLTGGPDGGIATLINAGSSPNALISLANATTSQFVPVTGVQFGGALQFMLSHVANVAEITNLYDNYRIRSVIVSIIPGFNNSDVQQGSTATTMNIPTMHYTIDQDDAVVPANRNDVMQNSYAKTRRLDSPFSIVLKPRAQNVVATSTGTAAAGMLPANQWLDSSSTAIPHYGLKFWIDEYPTVPGDSVARPWVKFSVTYIIEAKNVV